MKKYFVVPMPLNKEGQGPETNPELITKVVFEVWDVYTFETESEHQSQEEADKRAFDLNYPHTL